MGSEDIEWLFERVEEQLRHNWDEIREVYANSKGNIYEQTLSDFLSSYFGGVYDINTKVAFIDSNLVCFEEFDFTQGNEEIDVVASFSQSNPRIIWETGQDSRDLKWVPFEGIAFICEVKSQFTKQNLIKDLEKLESISQVSDALEDRFSLTITGEYTISNPIQCLVYDKASISDDTLENILTTNYSHWHMILLVESNVLLLNRNLPFSKCFLPGTHLSNLDFDPLEAAQILDRMNADLDPDIITLDNGLFWFLIVLSASIPQPMSVNTANSLLSLVSSTQWQTKAVTEIEDMEQDSS